MHECPPEPLRQSGSPADGPAPSPHLRSFPLCELEKARKSPQQWICVYISYESLEEAKPAHDPTNQGGNAAEPHVISDNSVVSPRSQSVYS